MSFTGAIPAIFHEHFLLLMGHSSGFGDSEPIPTYRYIPGWERWSNLTVALRQVAVVAKFLDDNKPKHQLES